MPASSRAGDPADEGRRRRDAEPAGARTSCGPSRPASGWRSSRCRTSAGRPTPTRSAAAVDGRRLRDLPAAQLLRLPRGPAPDLAAAANDAGALPVAHVDLMSLGRARGAGRRTAARLAIGEGQCAGNPLSYGGPALRIPRGPEGALRRLPGPDRGGDASTATGERGYVLTLQTREQHIRREKATSNITTNQTLLALGGLVYLSLAGAAGAARGGASVPGAAAVRQASGWACQPAFDQPTFKEFARAHRPAGGRGGRRGAQARASIPATRSAATTRAWTTPSWSRVTEKRTRGRHRPAGRGAGASVAGMKLDLRALAGRAAGAGRVPDPGRRAAAGAFPPSCAAPQPPRLPELAEPELVRHFTELSTAQLRHRHGLLSARLVHDEVQPAGQRARGGAARLRATCTRTRRRGRPRARWS